MDAADSAEVAEQLGPYRLVARIGEGGMGVVYLGLDADRRTIAVKVLRPHVAADEVSRERLAREVDTMRAVASPHVAEVLGADLQGERPYIATRYVQGRTLDEVVASDGPLTGSALTRLGRGLAEALSAIHAAGVIHRDVKPSNVVLVDGEPVVIDFGVAQAADATKLTQTGMFMGTPAYMAPEVLEGGHSTSAADVHAWGAVLANAATGRSPFGSGSNEVVFSNIARGRADLAGVPEPLAGLVRAALVRDPAGRPPATWLRERSGRLHERGTPASAASHDGVRQTERLRPNGNSASPEPGGGRVRHPGMLQGMPAAPHAASHAASGGAAPGGAAAGGAPPAGQGHPGTRPYTSYDAAYAPPGTRYATERQPRGNQPGHQPPHHESRPPRRPRPVVGWLLLAVLAGLTGTAPGIGIAAVFVLLVTLRTTDNIRGGLQERRSRHGGPRDSDAVLSVAGAPWHVVRAGVATLFQLLLPVAAGAAVVGVLLTVTNGIPSFPVALGGCVFVVLAFFGPGGKEPRRRAERVLSGALRDRTPALITACVAAFLLLVALSAIEANVLVSWPMSQPWWN